MSIDEAREYLKEVMKQQFIDKTFGQYIQNDLAGDFAAEMATILQKHKELLEAYRFIFRRKFLYDQQIMLALRYWQPQMYDLVVPDLLDGEDALEQWKLQCSCCHRVVEWKAKNFFDAADKQPAGWTYDRVMEGPICPKCKSAIETV